MKSTDCHSPTAGVRPDRRASSTPNGATSTRVRRRLLVWLTVVLALGFMPAFAAATTPAPRNLFSELLGKSDTAVAAKLDAGWQQLFYGNDETQRVYYPVGDDMAYIADVGSHDVRSEGMSYGMMIAVQMNHRPEFDRLWKWAKTHMYHADGPRRGYFAWHCAFDGHQLDPGSASDGEEWFAMALLFAAHRWSSESPNATAAPVDYNAEAQALLHEMLHKQGHEITAIFDRARRQVVFAPTAEGSQFTDPSYHLPAFYQLWGRWAEPADRPFWQAAAAESRTFFHRAAHAHTGLMPEYAQFNGSPLAGANYGGGKNDFRFDAWRTLANVAIDHAWFAADPWQFEQSNRVLRFLLCHAPNIPNQFTLDGKPLSTDVSIGLVAMAAVAGLAAEPNLARPFVQRLWKAEIPSGKWRYYDGLLYQLALLQVSGNFRIYEPSSKSQ